LKRQSIIIATGLLCAAYTAITIPALGQTKKAALISSKKKGTQTSTKLLPADPELRTGTLPNGFSYYIRKNDQAKNRVELYLANKVGSVLEDDDQQGLAHFIEHMNFNGTTHFPKNELVDYLQKAGVRFGADLNAYTSFDETVYQLPIPTNDPALLKNGLLIMRDWAQEAVLDSMEIEKERGVILEEERLGKGARDRMSRQTLPVLLNHSRFASRLPIGKDEILTAFKPAVLRRFYHDWYRPNLQALIVVGDLDPDAVEKMIIAQFSDLKNPEKQRIRTAYTVPLTGKGQFIAVTDKEIPVTSIEVMYKQPATVVNTEAAYLEALKVDLLTQLLANRKTAEASKENNPLFMNTNAGISSLFGKVNMFDFAVVPKAGFTKEGFQRAWLSLERIKRFGFTAAELENVKKVLLSSLEEGYKQRNQIPSNVYVKQYQTMFLRGETAPGIPWEYNFRKANIPAISLKDISMLLNNYLQSKDVDIIVAAPEKDKGTMPNSETIKQWMDEVNKGDIQPFTDDTKAGILLANKPKPGNVVKKEAIPALDITTLTLSNGVKVVLKPTTFKNDQITYTAFCPGGTSLYDDSDYDAASMATQMVNNMGAGSLSPQQLAQTKLGKQAGSAVGMTLDACTITGGGNSADLETALQLTYLQVTQPREDAMIFNKYINQIQENLKTQGVDPASVFNDSIGFITGNYNYRFAPMTVTRLKKITMKRMFEIYRERFADASGFTFVFVGDFKVEVITPLLEQYLGALPSLNRKNEARDLDIHAPRGILTKKIYKGTEDKASVRMMLHDDYAYNNMNNLAIKALGEILEVKIVQHLREQESEVYSPSVQSAYHKLPSSRFAYMINFGCAPKNVDHLIAMVKKDLEELGKNGPDENDLQKFKAAYEKSHETALKDNSFWLKYLSGQLQDNENLLDVLDAEKDLQQLNITVVKDAAGKYLTGKNLLMFELLPEQPAR